MSLKSYFRLFEYIQPENQQNGEEVNEKRPTAFLQWLALFFGVIIQPFFTFFRENGKLNNITEIYSNYFYIIFGIIVATIIFPSVYRSTFDTDRPKFLQIIPIFTAGLGWQTMVESIINGATKTTLETDGETSAAILEFVINQLSLC
ncbi:hypothetical protein [Kordia sp.]|uniref:hypothetical protein n=1 Tax=Kordia sp. TaxID=1965332 RepID=UPI003B5B6A3E